jgi:hypothetical protein
MRFSASTLALCFSAVLGAGPAYPQGRDDGQWTMPGKDYAGKNQNLAWYSSRLLEVLA